MRYYLQIYAGAALLRFRRKQLYDVQPLVYLVSARKRLKNLARSPRYSLAPNLSYL